MLLFVESAAPRRRGHMKRLSDASCGTTRAFYRTTSLALLVFALT